MHLMLHSEGAELRSASTHALRRYCSQSLQLSVSRTDALVATGRHGAYTHPSCLVTLRHRAQPCSQSSFQFVGTASQLQILTGAELQ
jgi:hypothetical protein